MFYQLEVLYRNCEVQRGIQTRDKTTYRVVLCANRKRLKDSRCEGLIEVF